MWVGEVEGMGEVCAVQWSELLVFVAAKREVLLGVRGSN